MALLPCRAHTATPAAVSAVDGSVTAVAVVVAVYSAGRRSAACIPLGCDGCLRGVERPHPHGPCRHLQPRPIDLTTFDTCGGFSYKTPLLLTSPFPLTLLTPHSSRLSNTTHIDPF